MKASGQYFVPDIMGGPTRYLTGWEELKPHIRPKHKRSVVQAGGHIGIFPAGLSAMFDRVYTFEPDFENFSCLVRNAPAQNVFAARAALGAVNSCKKMDIQPKNTGGHQVTPKAGEVPVLRIDNLGLTDCDAVILDLEGYEFFALLGATETIVRCAPLVIVEQNKKSRGRGFQPGAIELLLNSLNYRLRGTAGENLIFEAA